LTVPDRLPPAFFPVSLNVDGRRCVVIGDDREAAEKAEALGACGADVVRLTDPAAVRDADVTAAFFVVSTPIDEPFSRRLRALADEHRFLLCCIDQPRYGFVAMAAVVASGPARIAISTGGVSPRVGAILRTALARALDGRFAAFLERLAAKRREVRTAFPDDGERRRAAMRTAAEGFEVDVELRYPQWFREET
jgi:precorrin-2 dehydrogenase / sirohydrochlorin ferrochelatase